LPITSSRMGHLWDALVHAYEVLGFGKATAADEVFRDFVLARIIEPTSKLDSARVLDEGRDRPGLVAHGQSAPAGVCQGLLPRPAGRAARLNRRLGVPPFHTHVRAGPGRVLRGNAEALTIDHASHGRFDLALGAAWAQPEHQQLGIAFPRPPQRFDLLEDALEIVTRLYTGERVSCAGRCVSLDGAQMRPLPVQRPRPPIWIGGSGRTRTLPLVARFADVWHPGDAENYAELSDELERLTRAAGRDAADIRRAASLSLGEAWDEVRASIEKARSSGSAISSAGGRDKARGG
jgi:hypothetical protein